MIATASPIDRGYHEREAYAAIYARKELKLRQVPFETFDPCFGVCGEIESPFGPMLVYGSIITYHLDGVGEGFSPWARHKESSRKQGGDWLQLRRRYPTHSLTVAGDFNQALDKVGRYRETEATDLLMTALTEAGLRCLTDENFVANEKLKSRHSVDHIAISEGALSEATYRADAWEATTADGIRLSDHNGVVVTLDRHT
jgi:hypothetical protein